MPRVESDRSRRSVGHEKLLYRRDRLGVRMCDSDAKRRNGESLRALPAVATRALLDVVYPPQCRTCGVPGSIHGHAFCPPCWQALRKEMALPACAICGGFLPIGGSGRVCCASCLKKKPRVLGTVRVAVYQERFGELIKQYKYKGRQELEGVLGGWLAAAVSKAPWFDRVEAVVPVPTCWRHRISRPLHAAERLARQVARETNLPCVSVLRRTRAGRHQVGLPYSERAANIRGAFAMRRGVKLKGARLLIVDDVRTTGATIQECSKMLLAGGAAELYAGVLATVVHPDSGAVPPPGA